MTGVIDTDLAWTAFAVGVVASISLPLGAVTSRYWIPEERTVAALMAFGGGALLAALSIDLVAPALEHGHFFELASGAILGGVAFVVLNELVNDYGGFVRKVSTSVYHLRRKQHQRYRGMLSRLADLDLFGEIEERDFRAIAAFLDVRHYGANTPIYSHGDPSEGLYVLASGRVSILDPREGMDLVREVGPWETFSRLPFLIGVPHDDTAVTVSDCEVWLIPRDRFLHLLVSSPRLGQAVHTWLRSRETEDYLVDRLQMTAHDAQAWLDRATRDLVRHAAVPQARGVERKEARFLECSRRLTRSGLLTDLSPDELAAVAERLVYKHCRKGEALFHEGQAADRLFILDNGAISLLSARDPARQPELVTDSGAVGTLGFVTGAPHSTSAVAAEDTAYWILLRRDLPGLLAESPTLHARFEHFISSDAVTNYLRQRHGMDPDKVGRWLKRVRSDLEAVRPLTAATSLLGTARNHHGAALAIWLGILLDGIPESLVLGTIQAQASLSLSLVAGLFIANYPEALSSSIGMRHQGLAFSRVLLMWTSLVLFTGLGAALGALWFGNASIANFALIEGIAAGAMLTMIAQTMLPEAYLKGGNVVGLATLIGFLTALMFKELG